MSVWMQQCITRSLTIRDVLWNTRVVRSFIVSSRCCTVCAPAKDQNLGMSSLVLDAQKDMKWCDKHCSSTLRDLSEGCIKFTTPRSILSIPSAPIFGGPSTSNESFGSYNSMRCPRPLQTRNLLRSSTSIIRKRP